MDKAAILKAQKEIGTDPLPPEKFSESLEVYIPQLGDWFAVSDLLRRKYNEIAKEKLAYDEITKADVGIFVRHFWGDAEYFTDRKRSGVHIFVEEDTVVLSDSGVKVNGANASAYVILFLWFLGYAPVGFSNLEDSIIQELS